jgi:hypothetical protein
MSSYREFVKMHFHSRKLEGLTPQQKISEIAKMWREHSHSHSKVHHSKTKAGSLTAAGLKMKKKPTHHTKKTHHHRKGAGLIGDIAHGIGSVGDFLGL